jgi:hypothetical protein
MFVGLWALGICRTSPLGVNVGLEKCIVVSLQLQVSDED